MAYKIRPQELKVMLLTVLLLDSIRNGLIAAEFPVSGTLAAHEPDVVPVEISWMAEGPDKVAPIGPVGTERPPGADATHSKSMHVPSEPASSSLWP